MRKWQRIAFVVIVAAALAWVFLIRPALHTGVDDGMNGGQQAAPALD